MKDAAIVIPAGPATGNGPVALPTLLTRPRPETDLVDREELVADLMSDGFARMHPDLAARSGFRRWQVVAGALVAGLLIAAIVLVPQLAALTLAITTLSVSVIVTRVGLAGRRAARVAAPDAVLDDDLPFYTVLVPAYREEAVIGDAVRCLSALDYPADRIEVLILVERRDLATQLAIAQADPAPFVRTVQIPPGRPQTKPRSCNAGLLIARGELIVIFDAEDRPDPDQLRKAAAAFRADELRTGDRDLACVQAQLRISNAGDSLITRQFALEYDLRYRLMLPGLARLDLPIPLGGTSNHFRTAVLRRMGGWDAWNVTEDADLGMRCRSLGYRVRVIESTTRGEAPARFGDWVRQRTRWFKGFLLTTVVHTRNPLRTARMFGPRGLLAFYAFVLGAPLMFLTQPLLLALTTLPYEGVWTPLPHVGPFLVVAGSCTVLAWLLLVLSLAGDRRDHLRVLALLPVYWAMQWVAAWRALHQLLRAPFLWEKTPHGADSPATTGRAPAVAALREPMVA